MTRILSARIPAALLCALCLFAGGCVADYAVRIDAMARPTALGGGKYSYRIENKNAVTGETRLLRQKEIVAQLKTALSAHGLYEAPEARAADIVVELSYGLGPEHEKTVVYQELMNGRPVTESQRVGPPPQGVAREATGYTVLAETTVLREKFLSVCARNNASGDVRPADDLWCVHVSIDDEGDDLRGHLPVLVAAAMDQIGRTTETQNEQTLRGDDEAIRFVRKGM